MRQGRQCLWQNPHLCYDNMLKCIRLHSVTLSPSKCLPFCTLHSKSKHSEPRRWWGTCTGECWLQWRCEANIMLTLGTQIFYWCTFISRCNQCNTLVLMVQNWVRSGPGAVLPLCKQVFAPFVSLNVHYHSHKTVSFFNYSISERGGEDLQSTVGIKTQNPILCLIFYELPSYSAGRDSLLYIFIRIQFKISNQSQTSASKYK